MGVPGRLVPMTEAEIGPYEHAEAAAYAEDNVLAGYWQAEEALGRARQAHRQILPQGMATPGHHFSHIEDEADGETVGAV
jgi:hypothetical protein